jgi:uncharacterized membrane protein YoaK (UPF0700 family)
MMNLTRAAHAIIPSKDERHGPLPLLLVLLTIVTGVVDAVSFLKLGHVFVANMTGNVVFLGFAAAGVQEFWSLASLVAIATFMVGALAGGRLALLTGDNLIQYFTAATFIEVVLVGAALACSISTHGPTGEIVRYVLIVLLALTMGVQNAAARRLGVPNMTTTVLTSTLTGLAADLAGSKNPQIGSRLAAVGAMFLGAALGAVVISRSGVSAALALAFALIAVVSIVAYRQPSASENLAGEK